jgi:hypothetical protein
VAEELGRQLAAGLANADRSAWDRTVAQALQRAVLPDSLPRVSGLDLAVGDVVGHNVAAASVMAQVRNLLRGYAVDKADPAATLAATDAALELENPA